MSAPALKITNDTGTSVSVDMTNLNPKLTVTGSNPISVIPPPSPSTGSATAYSNISTILINLKMLTIRVTIDFTSKDGIGDLLNLQTLTTNAQKLMYFFNTVSIRKKIYINTDSNYAYCHIMSYSCTEVAGQKGIVNHSLELVLVSSNTP
jgi:hypothetical protein